MFDYSIYNGKRVFVTGHTGFKGTWLCRILAMLGADVTGYALEPPTEPSLFEITGTERMIRSAVGDIRNFGALKKAFDGCDPEIVFHLAAQPIVREGYRNPACTYETNVMGTVNLLECARLSGRVRSFLNVTTDKVYMNPENPSHAFTEDERLDGFDPYSNSKSCSELVTASYKRSFFADGVTAVSTARAGNVIGGGDYAPDRIVPDCVRAITAGRPVRVRNRHSVRPYQHVLEPLFAYLLIAGAQMNDRGLEGSYNVGPALSDCRTTGELATAFTAAWGDGASWTDETPDSVAAAPHEAGLLRLDSSLIKERLGFVPLWDFGTAVKKSAEWYKAVAGGACPADITDLQIKEYMNGIHIQ
ncbi:MAG: CDP-glucose 4,6-dehydratase [Clostridia bacterium]|nr:CDP-glucose 4,6-dehydratase [Clostridia bacterium]